MLTLVELEAEVSAAAEDAVELEVDIESEGQVTEGEAGTSTEAGEEPYGQLEQVEEFRSASYGGTQFINEEGHT